MKRNLKTSGIIVFILLLVFPVMLISQTNQYLHFDKVDDFCQLPNGSQYVSGSNQLSLTGWFYCDALAYGQGYMGFRSGSGTAEFYLIQLNNGVMECRLVTTTGFQEYVAPANTIIPQVWQHIAWIYDGTAIKLYVNGTLKGSSAASGTFLGDNVTFAIGKSILGGFNFVYGGRVDEVSVWKKALTQSEIQDMMENELTGTETDLELYYKFNQGVPGGDNTAITHLICEIGGGERDAELMNFALTGETSNFNGTLDPGYQAISFPQIPNHLIADEPFAIEASSTSGLEVVFTVLEGPATIEGNIVTLTGVPGEVKIEATQPGNGQYDPADPVVNSFMVLDPMTHVPDIDIRHPLAGNVYVPSLSKVLLSTYSTITYPELFQVQGVKFNVDGADISAAEYTDGYYLTHWTPPAYGNYTLTVISTNNYGASATKTININVVQSASDEEVIAADSVLLNTATASQTVFAELPSFQAAYNSIIGTLQVKCPDGGCGEWDRVASVDARSHDGQWFEIIRYITPYGKACSHTIDLTDFASMLQGKVEFRFNCATLDNGYYYGLTLDYIHGTPTYPYSTVYEVWNDIYPFGDYADLQPVEPWNFIFPDDAVNAKLKVVSTGHGWGDLNTDNAAEFYEATHHIYINGTQAFEQHNWYDCNPNPDGCQPQNGTWYYNRAGWCPGAIAQWFDYDMTPYIDGGAINMDYIFYEDYVDLCHPNHPDCVTGVTCTDCNDGFNPTLDVACNLVVFSNEPLITEIKYPENNTGDFTVSPVPSNGKIEVRAAGKMKEQPSTIELMTLTGLKVRHFDWNGKSVNLDLSAYPDGVYLLIINTSEHSEVKKIILQ